MNDVPYLANTPAEPELDLEQMAAYVKDMTLDGIYEAVAMIKAQQDESKAQAKIFQDEIASRFAAAAVKEFKRAEKQHGTVKLLNGEFEITAKVDKEVDYATALLREAATSMPWEKFLELFKVEISVPEKLYKAAHQIPVSNEKYGTLLEMLDAHRTTVYKDAKFTITKKENQNASLA